MPAPATELEDLSTPDAIGREHGMERARPNALSLGARVALYLGVATFTISGLLQALIASWAAIAIALLCGSAEFLVHTGGLETQTFATCSIAAAAIDLGIVVAIIVASVLRARRPPGARGHTLHPVVAASIWLSCALGLVRAFGWQHSIYFPYPLATIVVLASAYFFLLVGIALSIRLTGLAWRWAKVWSAASQFRTGFLTACLLLTATTSYWLLTNRWYAPVFDSIEARWNRTPGGNDSIALAGELTGLCIAADEVEPVLVHGGTAPACGFLPDDASSQDDCFSSLAKNEWQNTKQWLSKTSDLDLADLEDAIMNALVATCTHRPPPENRVKYFNAIARNEIRKRARFAQREVSCDREMDVPLSCAPSELPEVAEAKLAVLWKYALCHVGPKANDVFRMRLEDDASFAEIGAKYGMSESKAKDTFHNAIKRLRDLDLTACIPSQSLDD